MNKIKLAVLALSLVFGVAVKGMCSVKPVQDVTGVSLANTDFAGAIPCAIDNSTGTNAVLCFSGRAMVYGVSVSSVTNTDFIVLRDTATANLTSSTGTIIFANGWNANATGVATQTFKFPVPMKFNNGISANVSVAPTSGNGPRWTILYRPLVNPQTGD